MGERHTFHVNPPPDGTLPLLPCTGDAPQPAVAVDGMPRCLEGSRVDGLQRGGWRAREKCVDVVNLLIRLRKGYEV